jgi:hypothetical protein
MGPVGGAGAGWGKITWRCNERERVGRERGGERVGREREFEREISKKREISRERFLKRHF